MNKASRHYPAEMLQPPMPLQHTTVCSISNQLASTGCMSAGTAFDIDLPPDKVPTAVCQVHGGSQWPFAQQAPGVPQKAGTLPSRFFRTFRRLFGGR
jgi:penicillin-binding protein 1A